MQLILSFSELMTTGHSTQIAEGYGMGDCNSVGIHNSDRGNGKGTGSSGVIDGSGYGVIESSLRFSVRYEHLRGNGVALSGAASPPIGLELRVQS
jgi:hypothetical protein